jgi:hypothetical protein
MHSDLNNFKILKEGSVSIDLQGLNSVSFAHGANVIAPYKYFLFIEYVADGKSILIGGSTTTKSFGGGTTFFGSSMDATNITITCPTQVGSTPIIAKWYIYGSGKDATVDNTGVRLAVSASGKDVRGETNPDNFNFHSKYGTLKYFTSGVYSMTVSTSTTHTIPHNLGYVPFFIGFVNDIAGIISNGYAIMPYYFARSSIGSPNRDIAAFMFADATNIYVKAFFQPNAVGTSVLFNFYYKIFRNNLGF